MDKITPDINIAEIFYDNGVIHFRYSRYLSEDGVRWIRHGLFNAYYENGSIASRGNYLHGREDGFWQDFFENGVVAAEGFYKDGVEVGEWRYWGENGEIIKH